MTKAKRRAIASKRALNADLHVTSERVGLSRSWTTRGGWWFKSGLMKSGRVYYRRHGASWATGIWRGFRNL